MLRFPPQGVMISIHAPREGSDIRLTIWQAVGQISIHAPREGSDVGVPIVVIVVVRFQSTLPVRGATSLGIFFPKQRFISIHAPREGSDRTAVLLEWSMSYFNPRSP